jgi:hypothetical protein
MMKKLIKWLNESNHWKHIAGGSLIGLFSFSWYCALFSGAGVSSALEFKDKQWGGMWDWIDWSLTMAGVIVGKLLMQLLLPYIIYISHEYIIIFEKILEV